MRSNHSIDDLILNYDPESPAERFREAGLPAALKSSTGRLPGRFPGRRATRRRQPRSLNPRLKQTISDGFAVTMRLS